MVSLLYIYLFLEMKKINGQSIMYSSSYQLERSLEPFER